MGTVSLAPENLAPVTGVVIVSISILYFAYLMAMGGLDGDEKKRIIYIFLLFVGAAMFWAGFEQAASSLNLFGERLTDRVMFGWEMPASWFQSVNAMFIILLAPDRRIPVGVDGIQESVDPGQVRDGSAAPGSRLLRPGMGRELRDA